MRGVYVRGWMGNFGISDYYRPIPEQDHWLRRRIRMCYWKQWRGVRNRIRHLLALGTRARTAIWTGMSSKSYWHLSRSLGTQTGMTNGLAEKPGLDQHSRSVDERAWLCLNRRVLPSCEPLE
jgi:RNA-directed DNA polymerase